MSSDLDPQTLWQSQQSEHAPLSLAEIHDRSRAFQARIRRRNLVEYAACVFVVLGFAPALFARVNWMIPTASALIIAATLFVAWQLHRRGSSARSPESGAALTDFHRTQLTRQRDAVRSVAAWYIAPFVPGMLLLLTGVWFVPRSNHLAVLLTAVLTAVIFTSTWWLNQKAATRLQQQLDALPPSER